MNLNEIWYGGSPRGREGFFFWGGGFDPVPHPPGMSGYLNMLESSNKTLQLITFKNLIWIILGSAG